MVRATEFELRFQVVIMVRAGDKIRTGFAYVAVALRVESHVSREPSVLESRASARFVLAQRAIAFACAGPRTWRRGVVRGALPLKTDTETVKSSSVAKNPVAVLPQARDSCVLDNEYGVISSWTDLSLPNRAIGEGWLFLNRV
jgi:hypothetical protein